MYLCNFLKNRFCGCNTFVLQTVDMACRSPAGPLSRDLVEIWPDTWLGNFEIAV